MGYPHGRRPRFARWLLPVLALTWTAGCAGRSAGRPVPAATDLRPVAPSSRIEPVRPVLAALFGPRTADRTTPRSVGGGADVLYAWLAPSLRRRLGRSGAESLVRRVRTAYAPPSGVVEERLHREGPLRWYVGLFLASPHRKTDVRPLLLVEIALDDEGRLRRLLVREHYLPWQLAFPARHYRTVNRFRFVSTGEWTVLHGGPTRATNYHHGSRTQRWAYDLVVRRGGRTHPPGRSRNRDHFAYGRPVLAPAPGVVVRAVDGVAENPPGRRGNGGGNGVVIDHGFGERSSLWHGIPGTVAVKVGDRVRPGQFLFRVGNSGASTLPHIHFHVWTDTTRPPMGLPAPFTEVFVNRRYYAERMPVRGDRILRAAVERRRLALLPTGPKRALSAAPQRRARRRRLGRAGFFVSFAPGRILARIGPASSIAAPHPSRPREATDTPGAHGPSPTSRGDAPATRSSPGLPPPRFAGVARTGPQPRK